MTNKFYHLVAAALFIISLEIANSITAHAQDATTEENSQESLAYPMYFQLLRVQTNSKRELPDINFDGYRNAKWGEILPGSEPRSLIGIPVLGVKVTRYLDMTPDRGILEVRWRIPFGEMSAKEVYNGLVEIYGEPSSRNNNGIVEWVGNSSILAMRPMSTATMISARPVN